METFKLFVYNDRRHGTMSHGAMGSEVNTEDQRSLKPLWIFSYISHCTTRLAFQITINNKFVLAFNVNETVFTSPSLIVFPDAHDPR